MTHQAAIDRLQTLLSRVQKRAQTLYPEQVPFVEVELDSDEDDGAVDLAVSPSVLQSGATTDDLAEIKEAAPLPSPVSAPAPVQEHIDPDGWAAFGRPVAKRADELAVVPTDEANELVDKLVDEAAADSPHLFEPVEKPPISDDDARAIDEAIDGGIDEALLAAAQSSEHVAADKPGFADDIDAAKERSVDDAVAASLTTADDPFDLALAPELPDAKAPEAELPEGGARGVSAVDDIDKAAEIVAEIIAEQDAQARASVAPAAPTTLQINMAGVMITASHLGHELSEVQVAAYRNSLVPSPADTFLQAIERSLALRS